MNVRSLDAEESFRFGNNKDLGRNVWHIRVFSAQRWSLRDVDSRNTDAPAHSGLMGCEIMLTQKRCIAEDLPYQIWMRSVGLIARTQL